MNTSLADHWEGNFLGSGWHDVIVTGYRTFQFNSGNPGVEFEVQSATGTTGKVSGFVLVEKALWKLANFARACGLTKEEAAKYNPHIPNSHQALLNKRVRVRSEKPENSEYYEVVEWEPFKDAASPSPVASANEAATEGAPPNAKDIPF